MTAKLFLILGALSPFSVDHQAQPAFEDQHERMVLLVGKGWVEWRRKCVWGNQSASRLSIEQFGSKIRLILGCGARLGQREARGRIEVNKQRN